MDESGKERRITLLLAEDEPHLAFNLILNLEMEGYKVNHAATGSAALKLFREGSAYSLLILDVMLPEIDGFELVRQIREEDDRTGILMLTARASDEDRIKGFESGADDYITKPFKLPEFLLRVKRMVRRSELLTAAANFAKASSEEPQKLIYGNLSLDLSSQILHNGQQRVQLTTIEANTLKEFIKAPGEVLSRRHLLESVWGIRAELETRTVDNFIMRLRKYIEADPTNPKLLISVRGRGYKLVNIRETTSDEAKI